MRYLFIIDYKHLDNGGFLKLLAKHLSGLRLDSFMVLHADSKYTDRIMQTGMMREDAIIRSIKELNHRLTALFADEGIPMIAMNGYQRDTVTAEISGNLNINASYLSKLGGQTNVLLSSLVVSETSGIFPASLKTLAESLQKELRFDYVIAFDPTDDQDEIFVKPENNKPDMPSELPAELQGTSLQIRILKASDLANRENFNKKIE